MLGGKLDGNETIIQKTNLTSNRIFPVVDEIYFWSIQTMEHMKILKSGLTNYELQNTSSKLEKAWEEIVKKNFINRLEDNISQEQNHNGHFSFYNKNKIFLSPEERKYLANYDVQGFLEQSPLKTTIAFIQVVYDRLKTGEKLGWIYPSLAEHMLEEEKYFLTKIDGTIWNPIHEIAFINKHHGEELATTAQLLDPSEQKTIDLIRSYALKEMSRMKHGYSISGYQDPKCNYPTQWSEQDEAILKSGDKFNKYLELSIRYGTEIIEFTKHVGDALEKNELTSIIEEFVAKHVLREYIRFTKTLRVINKRSLNIN